MSGFGNKMMLSEDENGFIDKCVKNIEKSIDDLAINGWENPAEIPINRHKYNVKIRGGEVFGLYATTYFINEKEQLVFIDNDVEVMIINKDEWIYIKRII